MIKVALVRGKYLNNYEGQNFRLPKNRVALSAIASRFPLDTNVNFPLIELPSLSDFDSKFTKIIANRTLGDSQILFGLEKYAGKFDIFHSADPHYYYSYQLARLRQRRTINRLLLTSWETIPFNNETVKHKKLIKKFSMSNADLFLCYTQKAKDCLIKEGVKENKIKVIKLGVDLSRFCQSQSTTKDLTLLFVGRLVEEKGALDLYEAFKKTEGKRLKIVGTGPLESKIERLIKKDRLSDSVTIENKTYPEMPKVYQSADIFVMPSRRTKTWEEQYGMVLIEAMASGLPIIAYNTGVIAENLGSAGILIKENDVGELSRQIRRLVQSKTLRLKLGTMGKKRAHDFFDSRKFATKIVNLYETINSNFG